MFSDWCGASRRKYVICPLRPGHTGQHQAMDPHGLLISWGGPVTDDQRKAAMILLGLIETPRPLTGGAA
jgi:hypothetical protein